MYRCFLLTPNTVLWVETNGFKRAKVKWGQKTTKENQHKIHRTVSNVLIGHFHFLKQAEQIPDGSLMYRLPMHVRVYFRSSFLFHIWAPACVATCEYHIVVYISRYVDFLPMTSMWEEYAAQFLPSERYLRVVQIFACASFWGDARPNLDLNECLGSCQRKMSEHAQLRSTASINTPTSKHTRNVSTGIAHLLVLWIYRLISTELWSLSTRSHLNHSYRHHQRQSQKGYSSGYTEYCTIAEVALTIAFLF